jgi:hypothetical protein
MPAAVDRRAQQTGDLGMAIRDVQQAGANGELDIMRRNRVSGDCEWVAASDWKPHAINLNLNLDGVPLYVSIIYHHPDIGDWVYFCWQPDFDRLYSTGSAPANHDEQPVRPRGRAKVVLRYKYSTKAQMPRSLKAAWRAVVKECQQRDWQPPSEETVQRAAEELGYRPQRKKPTPRKRKRR